MVNIGDKVFYYKIKIDFINDKVEITNEEYNCIGSNDKYLVIDDYSFTSLYQSSNKDNDNMHSKINKVGCWDSKWKASWDYILGYIYTQDLSRKVALNKIKKEIEKFLQEKHGRYCKGIDLIRTIDI